MSLRADQQSSTGLEGGAQPEVVEFIRFCYRRRRVSWPEIYDDMCAVAGRGSFRGWGFAELAHNGVTFTIPDLPGLAALVEQVVDDERGAGGQSCSEPAAEVADAPRLGPLIVGAR